MRTPTPIQEKSVLHPGDLSLSYLALHPFLLLCSPSILSGAAQQAISPLTAGGGEGALSSTDQAVLTVLECVCFCPQLMFCFPIV